MAESQGSRLPVVIVDDEVQTLQSCMIVLRASGVNNVVTCEDSREIMAHLTNNDVGVLLLDLSMPHIRGEELLPVINEQFPEIPVLIITGANDVEMAVQCMKLGAFDYLVKPVEKSRLVSAVKRALEIRELQQENKLLKQRILSENQDRPQAFAPIITQNKEMLSIFSYVEAIAGTSQPVLITGETGVGKELMANAIHVLSGCDGEFVAVNVSGLDDTLFSDTLFGHKRGAFTGAVESRSGLVEHAANGTLFLDEIAELNASSQIKLLRLIQEHEYLPLGSDVVKRSSARIIVATNQCLESLINVGRFRKDLYYRLQIHHVHIPPLRKRLDDLPFLVDAFFHEAAHSLNKKTPTPPPELYTHLSTYHFPGNIRELKSMIFDAISNHESHKISLETFKKHIFHKSEQGEERQAVMQTPGSVQLYFGEQLPTLKQMSRMLIEEAMTRAQGNQSVAAQLLGISQQALSKRLKSLKMDKS